MRIPPGRRHGGTGPPAPAPTPRPGPGRCRRLRPATAGAQRRVPALHGAARQPRTANLARPSGGAAARAGHGLPPRAGKGNRGAAPVCSLTIARSGACAGARPPAAPAAGLLSPPSAILRARDAAGGAVTARKEPPPSPGAAPLPWARPARSRRRAGPRQRLLRRRETAAKAGTAPLGTVGRPSSCWSCVLRGWSSSAGT